MIPMLQELGKTRPWANSIIPKIKGNKRLHSMFYQDFRKSFISYWK